jgi:hypothetical protein
MWVQQAAVLTKAKSTHAQEAHTARTRLIYLSVGFEKCKKWALACCSCQQDKFFTPLLLFGET